MRTHPHIRIPPELKEELEQLKVHLVQEEGKPREYPASYGDAIRHVCKGHERLHELDREFRKKFNISLVEGSVEDIIRQLREQPVEVEFKGIGIEI